MSLLAPRARGESVWAYTSSFGGGMVAGDQTRLEVKIDAGARCFVSTQAATKIYRNPARRPCSHRMRAVLESEALLAYAPDPVQCFAESDYEQEQVFELARGANLILVDWISAGRIARGERWAFRRYRSRNEIRRDGRVLFLDSVLLENDGALNNRFRTGRFNCLGMVLILGPKLQTFAEQILQRFDSMPVEPAADLPSTASPIKEGVFLRFAGLSVEAVGRAVHQNLAFLPSLLADDPWGRKW